MEKVTQIMKKIGMVVAMQSEIESFISAKQLKVEHIKYGGFEIMKFNLGQNEVYCVRSGVGEIFASAATQMLKVTFASREFR